MVLAAAAAAAFMTTPMTAQAMSHGGMADAKVKCSGINACKGKGACATKTHACAGHNACKGKGWVKVSAAECAEKKGTVVK